MMTEKPYTYQDAEARYRNDPAYNAIVKVMIEAIDRLHLTPGEVRDAATFAATIWELQRARRSVYIRSES
jgi:hypothetical protein